MASRVVTIRLAEIEVRQLRRLASETNLPLATFIRAAVAEYVEDLTDGGEVYRVNTPCITPRYRAS